jgi:gamma-D-glutamyl-L-lysine dipeptidyl-peptidase
MPNSSPIAAARTTGDPLLVGAVAQAAVAAPIAPMLAEPHVSSAQVSQQLAGHLVSIVEDQCDWLLVRGRDEYEGWMHRGYLAPAPNGTADASPRISLGCLVRTPSGTSRALPLRALLGPEDHLASGEAIDERARARRFPATAEAIGRSAVELFVGTSYQWGGVTPWGADCSGLVQSVFALHGLELPRDAWQQGRTGIDAGRNLLAACPGDLLFFSDRPDGHITHVALALGERRIVHLALGRGGYAVERLDDNTDDYVAKLRSRFLFARSVL